MKRHRDIAGGSLHAFGRQRLDELRAVAAKRARLETEHIKPETATVLGVHLMGQNTGNPSDLFGKEIAKSGAFSDDAFESFQLSGGHRRLRFAHAVIRRERFEQSAFETIKTLVAEPLE